MENKIKRALVISGGGAKGAWAGGLIQQMIEVRKYTWDIYVGTSTGALLITLSSLNEMNRLKSAYTSVNNKNIFSVDPFTKNGKINILNLIWRVLNGKTSLGESGNLYKLIKNMFTIDDFNETKKRGKLLLPCAVDYTTNEILYGNNFENEYEEYIKYTLASTSVPIAMNFVDINNVKCLDGGVLMHVPIQKAIELGADEVDVIILRPENEEKKVWKANNIVDVIFRTIDLMQAYISSSNVIIPSLKAKEKNVKIRLRYTPYKLTENSLMFDKDTMLKWWNEGYQYGFEENKSVKIILNK